MTSRVGGRKTTTRVGRAGTRARRRLDAALKPFAGGATSDNGVHSSIFTDALISLPGPEFNLR
jgi:hypothetical protein